MRIGVRLPPCAPLPELVALARRAEAYGFDTIGVPDSQMLWRDCWMAMAAIAASTDRVTLMTAVTNAVARHPTVVASALRSVAELAPGRIRLGIGVGGSAVTLSGMPR